MAIGKFGKTKQQVKLDELRRREEEERTQGHAQSIGLPYVDLLHTPIDLEALSLIKNSVPKSVLLNGTNGTHAGNPVALPMSSTSPRICKLSR